MPGQEADVEVQDVGTQRRESVDAAYRAKYGGGAGAGRMVGDEAAATTLRLIRE